MAISARKQPKRRGRRAENDGGSAATSTATPPNPPKAHDPTAYPVDRTNRALLLFAERVEAHDPTAYPVDRTVYPVEKKMGEDSLRRFIVELLRPLIERWYAELGRPTFVGADQFIYYQQFDPSKCVVPDVYVLPSVEPGQRISSWKVWETGIVPSFALEVVSTKDPYKDYIDAPERYRELGVKELVVVDPDYQMSSDRVRWQRFRTLRSRGLVRVEATNADRIRSRVLGCWLQIVGKGAAARVRLATGQKGDVIFPTAEEMERAAKEEALRRITELEALVAASTKRR